MVLTESELDELQMAKYSLENPGFAMKLTSLLGTKIDKGIDLLGDGFSQSVGKYTQTALTKSLKGAIFTMKDVPGGSASNILHKAGVAASGGLGGFLGLASLAFELPLSTTIIVRSVADIARSQGESIESSEAQMACLEVFALGGKSDADDSAESGYYGIRTTLAVTLENAASYVAKHGLTKDGGPALVKAVAVVSNRLGIQVTQKAAAQAVPVVGAASGAVVNLLFIDHFQTMARGHFVVRRLERTYGIKRIREIYGTLPAKQKTLEDIGVLEDDR